MKGSDPRWRRLKEIVASGAEIPAAERGAYLDRMCDGDPELRAEAASLLSHSTRVQDFLETPAVAKLEAPVSNLIGRRLGAFRIVSLIAEGGMGEVYKAERVDGQFNQLVAIKVIRHGLGARSVLERFQVERQILASLEHPNVARLFDGGLTEEQLPYLVMELIEGEPIDVYCVRRQLSVPARLKLFREVCASVQYAHQRLIVHRDLKPSNILVTANGVPKLLDFGIAKVIEPETASRGGANPTLLRAMTPDYSSPEQVRGEAVTTSTDIYSLGVVLYRLLSGRSPYRIEATDRYAVSKAVCEIEPTKPSANVDIEAHTPSKQLRGDLDSIVLKAMRKEPEQRYASAEQFSEDIWRYLDHQPVMARKGTALYLATRFLERNKLVVAAGSIIFIVLIGGLLATQRQARIATSERQHAQVEQARAEKRFNDVRELSDSLIFDVHDAIRNLPGATAARELLLDRAVKYLDSAAADAEGDPSLQRELAWGYQRLSVVQGSMTESNLGDRAAALATNEKSLSLFERVAAHNPDDVIDQLNVAMMHRIIAFDSFSEKNERHLEFAMQVTSKLLAVDPTNPKVHSERSLELQHQGYFRDADGNRAGALESFRGAEEQRAEVMRLQPDYRNIHLTLGNTTVASGEAFVRLGKLDEGAATIKRGIELIASQADGEKDPQVQAGISQSYSMLGDALAMQGKYAAAAEAYARSRKIADQLARQDEKDQSFRELRLTIRFSEARLLAMKGRLSEAATALVVLLKESDAMFSGRDSIESSTVSPGVIALWLGEVDFRSKRGDEALEHFRLAEKLLKKEAEEKLNDNRRCQLAGSLLGQARVLMKKSPAEARDRVAEAMRLLNESQRPEWRDVPANYALANAYAVLADVSNEEARRAHSSVDRERLQAEGSAAHERSAAIYKAIPNPSRVDTIGLATLAL